MNRSISPISNGNERAEAYSSEMDYNAHGPYYPPFVTDAVTSSGFGHIQAVTVTYTDTYYIYAFDGKLLSEYDQTGSCVRDYIYAGNRLLAEYRPSTGKYYYYMSDQINSTRIITDDLGNVVYSEAYGPYGDVQKTWTKTYDPKQKFSGKEREGYSELDYFGARYFDNNSYRFISVDPVINKDEALSNPQLWNLYAYCTNNPITHLDPDGNEIFNLIPSGMFNAYMNFNLLHAFVAVWNESGGRTSSKTKTERGAWIYTDGTNDVWSPTFSSMKTWPDKEPTKPLHGSVHNHPDGISKPEPSDNDKKFVTMYSSTNKGGEKEFPHRGKPLYVVSSSGVWVYDQTKSAGDGRVKQIVTRQEFNKVTKLFN